MKTIKINPWHLKNLGTTFPSPLPPPPHRGAEKKGKGEPKFLPPPRKDCNDVLHTKAAPNLA